MKNEVPSMYRELDKKTQQMVCTDLLLGKSDIGMPVAIPFIVCM